MKKFKKISFIVAAAMAFSSSAFAHIFLDHADPRVGSELSTSPTEVKIWFTDEFDPSGTKMEVYDSNDKEVDLKDDHQDKADPTLLIVSVPTLLPGTYFVRWQGLCMYGHHTEGDFHFTIDGGK